MRILALYPLLPYPLNSGGKIRAHQVLSALLQEHEVHFFGLRSEREQESAEQWPLATQFAAPPKIFVPGQGRLTPAGARLRDQRPWSICGVPQWVKQRDAPELWNALSELQFDSFGALLTRTLAMAPFALAAHRRSPRLKLTMDLDDILSVVRRRQIEAEQLKWPSRYGMSLRVDAWRLRQYENTYLSRFDSVWVCSEDDRSSLGTRIGAERVRVVPNVIDTGNSPAPDAVPEPALLYVGDYRISFNTQAVLWFLAEAWPRIRNQVPNAQLWLVGREPPPELLARHAPELGIVVTGTVPDVRPYLQRAAISIAPLRVGGGTRIKILEAMAASLPVVSTAVGAEGIKARPGVEILLAESGQDFATECVALLTNEARRKALASAGRLCVEQRYGLSALQSSVLSCYEDSELR
jgi:glycosyltransferase involved in cell wall biosynthesis